MKVDACDLCGEIIKTRKETKLFSHSKSVMIIEETKIIHTHADDLCDVCWLKFLTELQTKLPGVIKELSEPYTNEHSEE